MKVSWKDSHDRAPRAKRKKAQAAWSGCGTCGVAFKVVRCCKRRRRKRRPRKREQVLTTQNKFYCNSKALDPAERVRHKQLTDKLIAGRKEIVEGKEGFTNFSNSPSNVSLAELADWVVAEGKCCPFFDFHIDLGTWGQLLCLRLTSEEGIKPFHPVRVSSTCELTVGPKTAACQLRLHSSIAWAAAKFGIATGLSPASRRHVID